MNLISIPAFQDNYIWVLSENNGRCIIVDPGEAAPVLAAIEENQWQPEAILLTHHHQEPNPLRRRGKTAQLSPLPGGEHTDHQGDDSKAHRRQ